MKEAGIFVDWEVEIIHLQLMATEEKSRRGMGKVFTQGEAEVGGICGVSLFYKSKFSWTS